MGIAKKPVTMDGITKERVHHALSAVGTSTPKTAVTARVVGDSGHVWAAAVVAPNTHNPIFVSTGHRVSLDTAVALVIAMSKHRVPEPIRQADLRSRARLRAIGRPPGKG